VIKLFKVNSLNFFKEIIPNFCAFFAGKANDKVADVQLAESVETFDVFLHTHAIETKHVALRVGTIFLFDLADALVGRVGREINAESLRLTLLALTSSHQ
jgi:hypothetical protein